MERRVKMKPVYLLDTNVISEFVKQNSNESVMRNLQQREKLCAICSTVWQESVEGYERLPEGKRKNEIKRYIEKVRNTYEIIPYDSFAAQICGELRAKCEKQGKTASLCDSQIAATAIANGMVLITHNTEDFKVFQENSFLKVEDWWD